MTQRNDDNEKITLRAGLLTIGFGIGILALASICAWAGLFPISGRKHVESFTMALMIFVSVAGVALGIAGSFSRDKYKVGWGLARDQSTILDSFDLLFDSSVGLNV